MLFSRITVEVNFEKLIEREVEQDDASRFCIQPVTFFCVHCVFGALTIPLTLQATRPYQPALQSGVLLLHSKGMEEEERGIDLKMMNRIIMISYCHLLNDKCL